jgi:hypothetical protein
MMLCLTRYNAFHLQIQQLTEESIVGFSSEVENYFLRQSIQLLGD